MTFHVGRNHPCPCGSGKKFKKCCLNRDGGAGSTPFTTAERDAALARLRDFALRPEFAEDRQAAEARFWAECAGDHHDAHKPVAVELARPHDALDTWFILDVRLRSDRTPLGLFLERYGSRLGRGERQYLERMRDTHLRPYQVIDVTADGNARLIDLWTGTATWVRESPDGRQLARWDLLVARLMRGGEGTLVIDGLPYRYPVRTRDMLLRALRRAHARSGGPVRPTDVVRFFKNVAMLFHHLWLRMVALGAGPPPGTAFVPPIVLSKAIFDAHDRTALVAALARHSDLEDAGDRTWVWRADPLELAPPLGRFALKDQALILETEVEDGVERGRELLDGLVGDAIQFRGAEHVGVQLPLGNETPSVEPAQAKGTTVTYPDTVERETLRSGERA